MELSDSKNEPPPTTTTEHQWKDETFQLTAPPQLSSSSSLEALRQKCHGKEALRQCSTSPDDKAKLQDLINISETFLLQQFPFRNTATWKWHPKDLKKIYRGTGEAAGVYLIVYNCDVTGKRHMKIGMANSCCYTRVLEQPHAYAVKLLDLEEIRHVIPDHVVHQIEELELPALAWHPDHRKKRSDLIRMQLGEAFLACSRECSTNTVLERFFQQPSQQLQQLLKLPETFHPDVISFMENIADGGIHCIFSWPTLKSRLYELMAERGSDFLKRRLPSLPNDQFVTLERLKALCGEKFCDWTDAVKTSPREDALLKVIEELDCLLEDPVNYSEQDKKCAEIRKALGPLQGGNYSNYVRPSQTTWGKGARKELEHLLTTPTFQKEHHIIFIERASMVSLQKTDGQWLKEHVAMENSIDVITQNKWALCLVRSRNGRRIVITASYFIMFAVDVHKQARFNCVQAYLTMMKLLHLSGNCSEERLKDQCKLLQGFCMGLEFGDEKETSTSKKKKEKKERKKSNNDDILFDDNPEDEEHEEEEEEKWEVGVRSSMRYAMPAGYFRGPPPNVLLISKQLKIGCWELFYLREFLGEEKTKKLQVAHRLLNNGKQKTSPIERVAFECEGTPDGQPCPRKLGDTVYPTVVVGARTPGHVFHGYIACGRCHRRIERQELIVLTSMKESGKAMTVDQERRHRELKQRVINHRTHVSEQWQLKDPTVRRKIKRNEQTTRGKRKPELPAKTTKKKTGVNRGRRGARLKYPQSLIDIMREGVGIWIKLYGQRTMDKSFVMHLLDAILMRDFDSHGMTKPQLVGNGHLPVFHVPSYEEAMFHYLIQVDGRRMLQVKDLSLFEPLNPSGETEKVLIDQVMKQLFPTNKGDEEVEVVAVIGDELPTSGIDDEGVDENEGVVE